MLESVSELEVYKDPGFLISSCALSQLLTVTLCCENRSRDCFLTGSSSRPLPMDSLRGAASDFPGRWRGGSKRGKGEAAAESGRQPWWLPQSPCGTSKHSPRPWLSGLGSSPLGRSPVYFSALSVPRAFHFLFPFFSALISGPHATRE